MTLNHLTQMEVMIPNAKNKRVVKNMTILDVKSYFPFFSRHFFSRRDGRHFRIKWMRRRARWSRVE